MKKNLHLTATLDQPELLEDMVEKLATRHYETEDEIFCELKKNAFWVL